MCRPIEASLRSDAVLSSAELIERDRESKLLLHLHNSDSIRLQNSNKLNVILFSNN